MMFFVDNRLIHLVITVLIGCFVVSTCQGKGVRRRIPQDAFLWPGLTRRGIHMKFSDFPDWSDIWSLMNSNGFFTIGKFCVKGAFILYEEPRFEVVGPDAFKILAGDFKCTTISENTKSIQPIGSMGQMGGPCMTFFEKPYFGSQAFPTLINVGNQFFRHMVNTRSAIIIGTAPWRIQLKDGKRFCLLPEFDPNEVNPVCLVRDFATLLGGALEEKNFVVVRATQGCTENVPEELQFRIQDCMYWSEQNATREKLIDDGEAAEAVTGRSIDAPGGSCPDESTKELFAFYKEAIMESHESDVIVGWANAGAKTWGLEMLDFIFQIIINGVADDGGLSSEFLRKARELFARKVASIWKGGYEKNFTLSEREYQTLIGLTQGCETMILAQQDMWKNIYLSSVNSVSETSKLDELIHSSLKRKTDLDPISEIIWLAGHAAGFMCHKLFQGQNHYWSLFVQALWNNYLVPIIPLWKKPQPGLQFYFGGINYNLEYKKLAVFTSRVRELVNELEPLERPAEVMGIS